MPDYYLGTKPRQLLDNALLRNLQQPRQRRAGRRVGQDPIQEVTPTGVRTANGEHRLDLLVLATGFDAITGALVRLNPRGAAASALRRSGARALTPTSA